jgi:hypothetical protein
MKAAIPAAAVRTQSANLDARPHLQQLRRLDPEHVASLAMISSPGLLAPFSGLLKYVRLMPACRSRAGWR